MTFDYASLAARIRTAHPDYAPHAPVGEDLSYLESLQLPYEVAEFYRTHAPHKTIGSSSQLLSISSIREEHEDYEPGITLRRLGCTVLVTANGNPYFCVSEDDGYRILYADHEEIGDNDETLEDVLGAAPEELAFTLTELLEAFAAQVLPASPHSDTEMEKLRAWRAART